MARDWRTSSSTGLRILGLAEERAGRSGFELTETRAVIMGDSRTTTASGGCGRPAATTATSWILALVAARHLEDSKPRVPTESFPSSRRGLHANTAANLLRGAKRLVRGRLRLAPDRCRVCVGRAYRRLLLARFANHDGASTDEATTSQAAQHLRGLSGSQGELAADRPNPSAALNLHRSTATVRRRIAAPLPTMCTLFACILAA